MGAAELLDPHVVLVLDPVFGASLFGSPVDEAFYGIEAVANFTRAILEDARVTMEAEEIVEAGDSVLVVHQRVTGKVSGVPLESRYFTLWSFRGHKAIRVESFGERAEALEAAGLKGVGDVAGERRSAQGGHRGVQPR